VPELIEVESYRVLAERALDRPVARVEAPDAWFLKGGLTASMAADGLEGRRLTTARRRGKLLVLDVDGGPTLGLRFGMTGRLLVDGTPAIERLEYSSGREAPAWDRFVVHFGDGGDLRLRDPRRLGGVELDPDESRLGPDASTVGPARLRDTLGDSTAPLKARLMDQSRLAGLGNLLTDEILWRAGLDPARAAGSLDGAELRRLHRHLRSVLSELTDRGGSHTGDLQDERHPGGLCPRDGSPLQRRTVGGRTTYSCPHHQR
jgi:formamidopyrimidine-DNA glycosylase